VRGFLRRTANRHLPEVMKLSGTVHINPKTAADNLQADFDGDRLAFAHKRDFPTLAAEVKEYNLPVNRIPMWLKKLKYPIKALLQKSPSARWKIKLDLLQTLFNHIVALQWETQLMPKEEQYGYLRRISAH
jgi:hypothetical protein